MKNLFVILLVLASHQIFAQSKNKSNLNFLLDEYVASIDAADSLMGKKFWSMGKEVSFIHPKGNNYGWKGVKEVYNMFNMVFSKRKLVYKNPKWTDYGQVAWVEFTWVFDAEFKNDNQKLQTKGRESQIWHKENNKWKLVHVHYSGLPVDGERQGF
jgi:hypothetical protein